MKNFHIKSFSDDQIACDILNGSQDDDDDGDDDDDDDDDDDVSWEWWKFACTDKRDKQDWKWSNP